MFSTHRAVMSLALLVLVAGGCFGEIEPVDTDTQESTDKKDTWNDGGSDTCSATDTVEHCGTCGNACSLPDGAQHARAACEAGRCVTRCETGWVDADGDASNGCEATCDVTNDGDEKCDGVDNDCDGKVDENFDVGESCTLGKGACQVSGTIACVAETKSECDVTVPMPETETCGDQVDNDCDGEVDEADASDAKTWYADADGDGFGTPMDEVTACAKPDGYVANKKDCDDSDASIKPRTFYADMDDDGYTVSSGTSKCAGEKAPAGFSKEKSPRFDCDDGDASVKPTAEEKCDGKDTNCNGIKDDIKPGSNKGSLWYVDCDGDGYSNTTVGKLRACSKPASSKLSNSCSNSDRDWTDREPTNQATTDCNDKNSRVYPGQKKYFSTPISNSQRVGSRWDYNCDKRHEKHWSGETTCQPDSEFLQAGWVDTSDVGCGKSEDYWAKSKPNCPISMPNCVKIPRCDSSASMRTQECR